MLHPQNYKVMNANQLNQEIENYIHGKLVQSKIQNGWKRFSKKRVNSVLNSTSFRENLRQKIYREWKDNTTLPYTTYNDTLGEYGFQKAKPKRIELNSKLTPLFGSEVRELQAIANSNSCNDFVINDLLGNNQVVSQSLGNALYQLKNFYTGASNFLVTTHALYYRRSKIETIVIEVHEVWESDLEAKKRKK